MSRRCVACVGSLGLDRQGGAVHGMAVMDRIVMSLYGVAVKARLGMVTQGLAGLGSHGLYGNV